MKRALAICLFTFLTSAVKAQSHNMSTNYNCRLQKKGYFFNSEKFACPACEAKENKEKAAKTAEDDRRMTAHNEKVRADNAAAERARLEKRRLAEEEARLKKEKELADQIARDKALKRYRELAASGTVKTNVKGAAPDEDLFANIKPFSDDKRRIYGFKINEEEVLTFPYEERTTVIDRIKNSNLFAVDVWKTLPNGGMRYSYSFIIDYAGKKISVDGLSIFEYKVEVYPDENKMAVFKKLADPESVGITSRSSSALFEFYKDKEAAVAADKAAHRPGWDMRGDSYTCYETCYYLDLKGDLLEKVNGYKLRIIDTD